MSALKAKFKAVRLLPALCLLLVPVMAPAAAQEGVVYTKFNIHVQGKADRKGNMVFEGSYANWIEPSEGHAIIPLNTPVRPEKGGGKFWERGGFTLVIQNPEKLKPQIGKVYIELDTKRMGMSTEEYIDLITSPQPVSMDQFSAKDLEGIRAGTALVGMSKKGVMAALGYPAKHETPSLDGNAYTYWKDRFRRVIVDFNGAGKVVSVR